MSSIFWLISKKATIIRPGPVQSQEPGTLLDDTGQRTKHLCHVAGTAVGSFLLEG